MNAYIKNMFEDPNCSIPVVHPVKNRNMAGSPLDVPLRTGSYYGWISAHHIQACVHAGQFDEESNRFCLTYPVKIHDNVLEITPKIGQCCMKNRVFDLNSLVQELQSESTLKCLRVLSSDTTVNEPPTPTYDDDQE